MPKQYASQPETKKIKTGHPEDEKKREAFLKVVEFLREKWWANTGVRSDKKSSSILGREGVYGHAHMCAKLKENLGEDQSQNQDQNNGCERWRK